MPCSNPSYLALVSAIHDAWPKYKGAICSQGLRHPQQHVVELAAEPCVVPRRVDEHPFAVRVARIPELLLQHPAQLFIGRPLLDTQERRGLYHTMKPSTTHQQHSIK